MYRFSFRITSALCSLPTLSVNHLLGCGIGFRGKYLEVAPGAANYQAVKNVNDMVKASLNAYADGKLDSSRTYKRLNKSDKVYDYSKVVKIDD